MYNKYKKDERKVADDLGLPLRTVRDYIKIEEQASPYAKRLLREGKASKADVKRAIIAAQGNDAIVLTDLILTTDKVNGTTAVVNITGGGNTVKVISADLTDAPCNIALPFVGRWETWRGAHVDLFTTGVVVATLALGYYRIPWNHARSYSAWNAER